MLTVVHSRKGRGQLLRPNNTSLVPSFLYIGKIHKIRGAAKKKNQVKGWWIYQQWHVVHVTFDSATVRSLVTIFRTVPLQMRSWSIRRCQTSSSGHPFFFHGWWKSGLRGRTDITLITQLGVGSSSAPSDDGRPGVFSGGRGTTHYWGANRTRLIGSPVSARIPRANINDEGELRSLSLS